MSRTCGVVLAFTALLAAHPIRFELFECLAAQRRCFIVFVDLAQSNLALRGKSTTRQLHLGKS